MARRKLTRAQALVLLEQYKTELSDHRNKRCRCQDRESETRELGCQEDQRRLAGEIRKIVWWLERN